MTDVIYFNFLADDPLLAIKYFHPSWVSDQQKLALCGQLVGMLNFCTDFEAADFISLQNGKFKFETYGRFIIAMGTDRNIQESLLDHRNELMKSILKLYHCDINKIFEQFDDAKKFSEKLYHIFETYLPVLQYNSNVLQNVYKLHLPKSASNLFLNANQILENVASQPGVLGGMILYNNKVICSQLSSSLTKILVATDPIRIKTTAEIAKNLDFYISSGSQIIKIYITQHEYAALQKHIKKVTNATSLGIQNILPLPFAIIQRKKTKDSMMKRDKSLIFSHIPEEPIEAQSPSAPEKVSRNFNRPNHLPLKLKTLPPVESGIASILSFDETDSYPDFIGKASVAQTPMVAMTPMAGPISSIFAMPEKIESAAIKPQKVEKKKWEKVFIACVENPFNNLQWKKKSYDDICKDVDDEEWCKDYQVYNTITDPLYPIIREGKERKPLSKALFDDYRILFSNTTELPEAKPPTTDIKIENIEIQKRKQFENDPMIMKRANDNKNSPNRILRNQKKKMLKLPIKSFSLDIDSGKPSTSAAPSTSNGAPSSNNTSIFDSPSTKAKKHMGGLQLTPLMSKLTLLAMSENESFSNEQSTPGGYYDTPVDNSRSLFNRLAKVDEEKNEPPNNAVDINSNEMKRVDLFVCGEKNMTLMIIADENALDRQIVQHMFEICVNRLSRLEQKLNDVINVTVDLKASDYSFMTFDKDWEVMQRSGSYDSQSTLLMHDHFCENKNLSDIILRTNDSIIYGHNNAGSEVFYQHAAKQSQGSFPASSEFTIISQAKRKLERDQSLVLF